MPHTTDRPDATEQRLYELYREYRDALTNDIRRIDPGHSPDDPQSGWSQTFGPQQFLDYLRSEVADLRIRNGWLRRILRFATSDEKAALEARFISDDMTSGPAALRTDGSESSSSPHFQSPTKIRKP